VPGGPRWLSLPLALLAGSCAGQPREPAEPILAVAGSDWTALDPLELDRWLHDSLERLEAVSDYECTLVSRETVDGETGPQKTLALKVRHSPFSVSLVTLEPDADAGQEVLYDESWNGGRLSVRTTGLVGGLLGRISLNPTGRIAMSGQRYAVTDTGLLRLSQKLDAELHELLARGDVPLPRAAAEPIDGRPGQVVELRTPLPDGGGARVVRIGFDAECALPVYYSCTLETPEQRVPLEEYLYRDIRWNRGLLDADFRP